MGKSRGRVRDNGWSYGETCATDVCAHDYPERLRHLKTDFRCWICSTANADRFPGNRFPEWNTVAICYTRYICHHDWASRGFSKISPRYFGFGRLSLRQLHPYHQIVMIPAMLSLCQLCGWPSKKLISSHFFPEKIEQFRFLWRMCCLKAVHWTMTDDMFSIALYVSTV